MYEQVLMKYDSDLQLALLRNQEIDGEVRDIETERSLREGNVQEKSEMDGEVSDNTNRTHFSEKNVKVVRNEFDTDILHSDSDIENMEFIDKKIAELNEQLKYWLDKKRKWEEKKRKEATDGKRADSQYKSRKEIRKTVPSSYLKHSSVASEHDNQYGSIKRGKSRNVNEYYNSIQESKDNLMSASTKS